MRVNVYAEEITDRCALVTTEVQETGATFYGIRFYLKTHEDMLPPRHPDDDSSGVTFWVKSRAGGFRSGDQALLARLFVQAAALLGDIPPQEALTAAPDAAGAMSPESGTGTPAEQHYER